jgi:hypothetical protein
VRAQGRCAGCGLTAEVKAADWHVLSCGDYADLYRKDPAAALAPAAEYLRWRESERAAERAADLAQRVGDTKQQRAESVARFARRDPLED